MTEVAKKVKEELLKKPEPNQVKFLELWQQNNLSKESVRECAIKAGYRENFYPKDARKIVRSIGNNIKMQKALKKHGINFNTLAAKVSELLEAQHPQFEGKPDNFVRHKTLETALDLYDAKPPKKIDIDQTTRTEIVISADLVSRIEKYQELDRKPLDIDGELLP